MLELTPIGMRLMVSTPQAMAMSTTPLPIMAVARLVACWDEPHWVSIVVLATVWGRPAASQAVRPMLKDCSPTWLTQPVMTWPTEAGSTPVRSRRACCTFPRRSAGCIVESPPLRLPMGERTASMMTTSVGEVEMVIGLQRRAMARAEVKLRASVRAAQGCVRARAGPRSRWWPKPRWPRRRPGPHEPERALHGRFGGWRGRGASWCRWGGGAAVLGP